MSVSGDAWKHDETGEWHLLWRNLAIAGKSCLELLWCQYKPDKGCIGNCACVEASKPGVRDFVTVVVTSHSKVDT